jgi:serine/threonine protein phosphatase PrpC
VTVLDVHQLAVQEEDVVVMATDGLWDVLSNEQVALLVRSFLTGNQKDDPHRYCSLRETNLTIAPSSYSYEDY